MKINTTNDGDNSRLPINRLKRPLKQRLQPAEEANRSSEKQTRSEEKSPSADAFEREILKDGAERFKEWLKKFEIK